MAARTESHWEPPEARKLLLTVHTFAELIDVPLTKAYSLSYVFERVYHGREQKHFRVTREAMVRRPEYQETQRKLAPAPRANVPLPSSSGRGRWWRNRRVVAEQVSVELV